MRNTALAILAAAGIVAIAVAASLALRAALDATTPIVVVEPNSMLPTLYSGDLVIVHKPPPQDIHIGDIIVYHSLEGRLVIHRVVKIDKTVVNGRVVYRYITKGDNNAVNDVVQGLEPPGGISYDEVLGVVYSISLSGSKAPLRIPYLGLLTRLLKG